MDSNLGTETKVAIHAAPVPKWNQEVSQCKRVRSCRSDTRALPAGRLLLRALRIHRDKWRFRNEVLGERYCHRSGFSVYGHSVSGLADRITGWKVSLVGWT
jgi:hypothetical protein